MPAFAGMTDVNWTPNYVALYLHYPQTMKERNMRLIIIVEKPPVFGQSAAYRGRLFLDTRPSRDDQFTWQSDVGGEWIRIGRRGFGPASWTLDPSLHASAGFSGVMRCFETHIDEQSNPLMPSPSPWADSAELYSITVLFHAERATVGGHCCIQPILLSREKLPGRLNGYVDRHCSPT
jgi:hypothetical protein